MVSNDQGRRQVTHSDLAHTFIHSQNPEMLILHGRSLNFDPGQSRRTRHPRRPRSKGIPGKSPLSSKSSTGNTDVPPLT